MAWWGWIAVGALLLVAEVTFVDLAFFLVFLGISAVLTGLTLLAGIDIPVWGQWLLFAGLSTASLVLFRKALYGRLHPAADKEIDEGVDGAHAIASEDIDPGERGAVSIRGATWTARNTGSTTIRSGDTCHVEATEGLVVDVRIGEAPPSR